MTKKYDAELIEISKKIAVLASKMRADDEGVKLIAMLHELILYMDGGEEYLHEMMGNDGRKLKNPPCISQAQN